MLQVINKELKRAANLDAYLSESKCPISFYEIVYAIENDNLFLSQNIEQLNTSITLAFTNRDDALKYESSGRVVAIMLGKLIQEVHTQNSIEVIGLNYNVTQAQKFDEFIFAPFYDQLTKQYLISPSDDSLALLSIDKLAHRHMGVEATFFSINNKLLPSDGDERNKLLANVVEDISFIIPRISQPRGSANIICLLVNLENEVEERAFIRAYKTVDPYTEVLFVNSQLQLLTGDLQQIQYNGENLEGVYTPIIKRQKES